MRTEKLYDLWSKRNPYWEIRYDGLLKKFCEYGKGVTSLREDRGKLFAAGYELLIVAFFIGLYSNQRRPLIEDAQKKKHLGWAVGNWGRNEPSNGRKPYTDMPKYIFIALIARTNELDFIELEKGNITTRKAVDMLMTTMEEYINYGLNHIDDKLHDNPNHYYSETAFLEEFLNIDNSSSPSTADDDIPDSLD